MTHFQERLDGDAALEELRRRAALVETAKSWIGTPYHLGGRLKGVGCDCASLLFECLNEHGLIKEQNYGVFAGDWWMHSSNDIYVKRMLRHAFKVAEATCEHSLEAQPGDIVLFKVAGSRVYNHGCIVVRWPLGIHAVQGGVVQADMSRDPLTAFQELVIMNPFRKEETSDGDDAQRSGSAQS